jgi:glyoxylase-like metal-dependent hydrolase (beta-lactamase superfamily II)
MTARIIELGQDRLLIDLDFRDTEGLVGTYVLPLEDRTYALIETGPSSCRSSLGRGVASAGIDARSVRKVLVTHIHLDHAGALGAAADLFPNATLYAHRLGVPHMIDPSRLIASARRAWGPAADTLWGPVLPVPPERLQPLSGGERFAVLGGSLEVLETPGHAKHHLAFFDSATRSIYTGDGAGVRLEGATRARPALPPPDLDIEDLIESVERMARLSPDRLLYSHFGAGPGGAAELRRFVGTVRTWVEEGLRAARENPDPGNVADTLRRYELEQHALQGPSSVEGDRGEMVSGYELAAQGLLRYFQTRGLLSGGAP